MQHLELWLRMAHAVLPSRPTRVLAVGALAISGASACKEKARPPRPSPVVSTTSAVKGPLPYIVVANGVVEPNRTVAVQSLVSGMITNVAIAEGDEVRQGQTILQIDARPFRAELDRVRGTLARDEAQLVRARGDSTRFAALAKDGYITKQQLDQSFADVSALAATVDGDRATLQAAQLDLENTTIRAPIAGRTGQLAIQAGNLVRAQADPPLVTINELRPVLVRFNVPERDFAELRSRAGLNKPLTVTVRPNVGDSSRATTGTLTFVNNSVDAANGSVLLKARVENANRNLWPGEFVTVGLQLSVDADAITLPPEAVVTSASGTFVYVLEDGKAKRIAVKVGRQSGALIKIDSGLVGGERVIVEGQNRLSDGAKVELRSATPSGAGRGRGRGNGGGATSASPGTGGRDSGGRAGSGRDGGRASAPRGQTP
jgi:multidrug efflux system membrane fusion protein